MPKSILIVEDEPALAALVSDYLVADGFSVTICADGKSGLEAAVSNDFNLILLDVMLPGLDGFEVCRSIRAAKEVPVLMLSARREDGDKIRGLGLGADDYITKPFSPAELVARVKSHLARYQRLTGLDRESGGRWITDGGLEINLELKAVRRKGLDLNLTVKEFELLALFIRNPERVFSKEELYDRIWGGEQFHDEGIVAVQIRRLREKVENQPSQPVHLETVWGMGYRWRSLASG